MGSKAHQHWLWYAYNTKTGDVMWNIAMCSLKPYPCRLI
ncbi:hypothetical protein EHN07_15480 [Buttiauxella warmboldiae]|uniref:Transposase n=1 Tax=Buttiauxella warmboldiae TaxID=82993 RepID=A0A3N5DE05_9ENTR|nr:hypothetical protein EHN07_15480 [Buttiauxella warmboldiae]